MDKNGVNYDDKEIGELESKLKEYQEEYVASWDGFAKAKQRFDDVVPLMVKAQAQLFDAKRRREINRRSSGFYDQV